MLWQSLVVFGSLWQSLRCPDFKMLYIPQYLSIILLYIHTQQFKSGVQTIILLNKAIYSNIYSENLGNTCTSNHTHIHTHIPRGKEKEKKKDVYCKENPSFEQSYARFGTWVCRKRLPACHNSTTTVRSPFKLRRHIPQLKQITFTKRNERIRKDFVLVVKIQPSSTQCVITPQPLCTVLSNFAGMFYS